MSLAGLAPAFSVEVVMRSLSIGACLVVLWGGFASAQVLSVTAEQRDVSVSVQTCDFQFLSESLSDQDSLSVNLSQSPSAASALLNTTFDTQSITALGVAQSIDALCPGVPGVRTFAFLNVDMTIALEVGEFPVLASLQTITSGDAGEAGLHLERDDGTLVVQDKFGMVSLESGVYRFVGFLDHDGDFQSFTNDKFELSFQVLPAPTITQQPTFAVVDSGDTASFTVAAEGEGPISYQWTLDGVDLVNDGDVSGADGPTLQIVASTEDAGVIRCLVSNANGIAGSVETALAVRNTCPGDLNGNGVLDPADFTTWLSLFNLGCP